MKNDVLLELAKKLMKEANVKEIEGVSIDTNTYEDGSSSLSINIDYPAENN